MPIMLFSIVDSPTHPDFSSLYQQLGLLETKFNSIRKAMIALKKTKPDVLVAEFIYGYSNNYAGVNISNLDVLLYSLQKYASNTKVIVFVDKTEFQYVDKLDAIFPLTAILQYPIKHHQLKSILEKM